MNNEDFFKKVSTVSKGRHQPRTVQTYISRLNALSKHYPDKNLSTLSVDEINEFLSFLKKTKNYKPASLRTTKDAFHFAYNILLERGLDIDKHSMKRSDREVVNIPSQDELFTIFESIRNPVYKIIIEFMYGTGVEISEVLRVKVKDLDFTKNIVKIKLNRNKGCRDALLPQKLNKPLQSQCLDKKNDCFVFSESCLKSFHNTSIQKAFRKAVIKNFDRSCYDLRSLRYAYVKHLESMNVPLMSITDHLKLSKDSSLEFYTRIGVVEANIDFSPLDRKMKEEFKHSHELERYVSDSRINDIESLKNNELDFLKLCQFLRELNNAFEQKQLLTIPMLLRSIINHIPPIFKCKNFSEVANNYSGSGDSFKQAMKKLDQELKHIADLHLHQQIRKKESLPKPQQIDFRPALDLLLQEILVQNK